MRQFMLLGMLLFLWPSHMMATTYFKTWVNSKEDSVLTQGSQFGWEYDVSVPGGSALVELYIDSDGSRSLTTNDVLLTQIEQTDGLASQEGPPPDTTGSDGRVVTDLGPFGFAPARYLLRATDQQDNSVAVAAFRILPLQNVELFVSGAVSKENVQMPDERLKNIMIEVQDEEESFGIWSGLTDETGHYTVNLPGAALGKPVKISFSFDEQKNGFVVYPGAYRDEIIQSGQNGPFDFSMNEPESFVYGTVYNEQMERVPVNDYGNLENVELGESTDFQILDGQYKAPALFDLSDSSDALFRLNIWGENLIPEYMVPSMWNDSSYTFFLGRGDSLEKNIYVQATDAQIYCEVLIDDLPAATSFMVQANNDSIGRTWTYNDANGKATLHVKSGYQYWVGLQSEVNGQWLLPEGYYLEDGNWRAAVAGDTVRFSLKKGSATLAGRLWLSPEDSLFFDDQESQIYAMTDTSSAMYYGIIDPATLSWSIVVPGGSFNVEFNNWSDEFLSMPVRYEGVTVDTGLVDTLDFQLNYAHAELVVKLLGLPDELASSWRWWAIQTQGQFPRVYESHSGAEQNFTYHFKVCDGDWQIFAPWFGPSYEPDIRDTLISVSEDSSFYRLDIYYKNTTALPGKAELPREFFVKQNYPNPFNPSTKIEFGLPERSLVRAQVFDVSGRRVASLIDGWLEAGSHNVQWDASGHSSGVYFLRLQANDKMVSQRLLLLK